MKRSVLFICTGNICRSPMAVWLLQDLVSTSDDEWIIESAGTMALEGYRASKNSLVAMENRGIEVTKHISRQITTQILIAFDLILVMERNHKEGLYSAFPEHADRIIMLSELIGRQYDIVDPFGGPLADYINTADEIERILVDGFNRILELTGYSST